MNPSCTTPLVIAAHRSRCPATTRADRQEKGCAIPPTRRPSRRSSRLCAPRAIDPTALVCAPSSFCSGAPGCGFAKRSRWPRAISTPAAPSDPHEAKAASAARLAWTAGESAGINRHGEGDENALHRRRSESRWPRVMRWRSVRAQRSVDRGRAGGVIEPRNSIEVQGADAFPCVRKAIPLAALFASRWRTLRGRRSQARTTSSMRENREISWSPARCW